ncbi:hypothetical protein D3C76_810130 [compost metagenome]
MDVPIGEKFRPRADRGDHHQVAALGIDLLATTYWRSDDFRRLDARFRGFFRLFRHDAFVQVQRPFTGPGRRKYRQVDRDGGRDVFDAAGADRQGTQAMLAANAHQAGQIDGAAVGRELVQGQDQRRVAEEVRRLGNLGGQLPIEALKVIAGQFQHGNGEHAALQLEHGILV